MKKMMLAWLTVASLLMGCSGSETSVKGTYRNPVIYADVPVVFGMDERSRTTVIMAIQT